MCVRGSVLQGKDLNFLSLMMPQKRDLDDFDILRPPLQQAGKKDVQKSMPSG